MKKEACVIAVTHINGKKYLFKNRDRNYVPEIKVYHILSEKGTEILYFKDERTGWVEGINEYGIFLANAALMVLEDEKAGAKKKSKDIKFAPDAHRMLAALDCKSLYEALHILTHYKTGVKGHTILSDEKHSYVIENTSKHEAKVSEILDPNFVRTNHGIYYPDAGYTIGENRESSERRYETAMGVIESSLRSPYDIVKKLFKDRLKDISSPFNVVRKTDNMFTSNQIIFDPTKKKMNLFIVDEDSVYLGCERHFSKKPVCSLEVKRITSDKDNNPVLEDIPINLLEVTEPPPNENVFRVFAYGSMMEEPELPEKIVKIRPGHLNNLSRSFNVKSSTRNHTVLGTKPYGSMQGLILEYPIEDIAEVLAACDKREGYQKERDPSLNVYIRSVNRAYAKGFDKGLPCVVYITNEESDSYVGEIEPRHLAEELAKDENMRSYLRSCLNSLISEGLEDKRLKAIRTKVKDIYKIAI
jgi:cation transport regulator ChaC